MIEPGDRIRLLEMPDDPQPIPVGTEGTVVDVSYCKIAGGYTQISVRWDNGRGLQLVVPPDRFEKV